jgi:pimeloyl-ACP methyl ester carboxylesterase
VLRFDYSCTGDSAGDSIDATVEAWLEDVDWALDELKDTAVSESVSIVGLRMGAALAALASRKREDVAHLVLWDPIVSGREYLDDVIGNPRPVGVVGVEGFPMSPTLRRSLDAIDLTRSDSLPKAGRTDILVSSEHQGCVELEAAMRRTQQVVHLEVVPSSGNWAQADPFGDALIPQNIIQAIVDRLQTQAVT